MLTSCETYSDILSATFELQREGLIPKHGDFVPSVHYPPITQYDPLSEDELLGTYTVPSDGLLDVYVHIPFCAQGCVFCHYPVLYGAREKEKDQYLEALEKEMDIYMRRLNLDKIQARSILVGGGTPTFLSPAQLNHFLDYFVKRIDFSRCTQFNYDIDPVTIIGREGDERLKSMRDHGVDRVTIGIQSLDENVLKIMNRHHGVEEAIKAIENCKRFGFQVNIEFIYGHPGETLENWREVMEYAVTLPVDEIQLYRLKVQAYGDRQGPVKKIVEHKINLPFGGVEIPDFKDTMTMKKIAVEILNEHGFEENMRRVYTRDKKNYSHYAWNQCCDLYDQVGFGLTAFSSLRDRFGLNTQRFPEYYNAIGEGRLPVNRGYVRTDEDQLRWAIVLPLKNSRILKSRFEEVTGRRVEDVFTTKMHRLKNYGLIEDVGTEVRLTKLGAFVADEVVEQFNSMPHVPFKQEEYEDGPLNPYLDNTEDDAFGRRPIAPPIGFPTLSSRNGQFPIDARLDVASLDDDDMATLLTATGSEQQQLFSLARQARDRGAGDRVTLRGVIEISNICAKQCDYCAMRAGNKMLDRYRMDAETILAIARSMSDTPIETIFLQAGQDVKCDPIIEEVVPLLRSETTLDILLCLGERVASRFVEYKNLGARSYILKFETSDPELHEQVIHAPLAPRLRCLEFIRDAGMKVGTGNIVGLPGQTMSTLIADIRLGINLQPDFVSSSPLIPNEHTPFEGAQFGNVDITLNTLALWRIALPYALIPSVSALERIRPGGQLQGLEAGANVMTINFTPKSYRDRYAIYASDRFIVELGHAQGVAEKAGLRMPQLALTR